MENLPQSPGRIKLSAHIVGWMIFLFTPLLFSPGPDFVEYISEPRIILSLVLRNMLLMIMFYVNLLYITPKLFPGKNLATFFVTISLMVLLTSVLNYLIHESLTGPFGGFGLRPPEPPPDRFIDPGHERPRRPFMLAGPYFSSLLITIIVATTSTLLVLWNNWVQAKANEQERNLQKVAAELSVLKLQISPHFLFNTLNNIRWLVRSKSDHAEPALVMLAQLLRYILYQTNHDRVPLDNEIAHLRDYISLQQMRLTNNAVTFSVSGELDKKQIVPLLLIPVVENFFKHGNFNTSPKGEIEITVIDNNFRLNTVNKITKKSDETELVESGIGLSNVKRRLALHYPGNHALNYYEKNDLFFLNLEINLS